MSQSLVDTSAKNADRSEGASQAGTVLVDATGLKFPASEQTRILRAIDRKGSASVGNIWGAAQGFVAAQLIRKIGRPIIAIASTDGEAESFVYDLAAFGTPSIQFPAREGGTRKGHADATSVRMRLQMAQSLAGPEDARPNVIVGSVLSMLQPVPKLKDLQAEFVSLKVGGVLDVQALLNRLVRAGYTREPLAELAGHVSLRGDILDVFPFASEEPLRIEMFEEEIESLRTFDPVEQRSTAKHEEIEVCLASDSGTLEDGDGTPVIDLLPADALIIRIEPLRVDEKASSLSIQSPLFERALRVLNKGLSRRRILELQSLPGDDVSLDTRSVQGLSSGVEAAAPELSQLAQSGTRVIVACLTDAERDRMGAQF
ncbi:MAG: transcription-repair coupling factor (superfamily II helicase), partial [Planctomycetota bacterium]